MQTVVIYDSKFGNTERVAEAIGRGAGVTGEVRVVNTADVARAAIAGQPDLVLLGGPTQRRGPSPALKAFLGALPSAVRGVPSASFDTRYRGPILLMGSAAAEADKVLRKSGSATVAPPESFFIGRSGPMDRQTLEAGELERAEQWGRAVAEATVARAGIGRP